MTRKSQPVGTLSSGALNRDGAQELTASVSRQAIAEQVVHRILELVKKDVLKPGQKLPSERDLAQSMGVGRPSLREALRALSLLGVLDIRQGEGVFVSSLNPESLLDPLQFFLSLDAQSLNSLFEARVAIESGIAEVAAKEIDDEHLERLQACIDQGAKALSEPARFLEVDAEFHQLIVSATKNAFLDRVAKSFQELGKASRQTTVMLRGVRQQSHTDHKEILEALRQRDEVASREAMKRHLENVKTAHLLSQSPLNSKGK